MKKTLIALSLAAASSFAAAAPMIVDAARSEITFVSKQMGVPVEGRFKKFTVQLDFDAKKPEVSKAAIEIDIASVDAGSKEANDEVIRKPWFHQAQFPKATFTSTAVKGLGGGKYEVTGNMTLKGRTKAVTAPFTVKAQGAAQLFEGAFVFNRSDFGIGDGPWNDPETVALDIQVRFKVLAAPAR
ncbi:MAG: YceI family protein [Burkholderiales bacterium]